MFKRRMLQSLVSEIADGTPIDWSAIDLDEEQERDRHVISQLKLIAAAAEGRHPVARAAPSEEHAIVFGLALLLAAVKAAIALLGWLFLATGSAAHGLVTWAQIVTLTVFLTAGGTLVYASHRDRRARGLGGLFLITAAAVADPLLGGLLPRAVVGPIAALLRRLPADAFLALILWRFAASFPMAPLTERDHRLARAGLQVAYVVGFFLFVSTAILSISWIAAALPRLTAAAALFDRQRPDSFFWVVSYGATIPGLGYLLWRSRFSAREERDRTALLAASLATGMAPMLLVTIFAPFVGVLRDPLNRAWVGLFLYLSLNLIVPFTMYTVLVHRVLDLRLIVTKATQLWLVRYAVWLVCLTPLVWLGFYTYANRRLPIADALADRRAAILAPLPLLGMIVLTFRDRLIQAFDRWVLGDSTEYTDVFARLQQDLRAVRSMRDITGILAREVDRAIHPRTVLVMVLDSRAQAFVSLTDPARPLPAGSTLITLLRRMRQELNVGADASGPVGRLLVDDDREWLVEHGVQLLVPMANAAGDLLAALAIGPKRTDLPFSKDDRLMLSMIASQGAVILENCSLRDDSAPADVGRLRRTSTGIDWDNEPAMLCPACHLTWPNATGRCSCGTATQPTALPLLVGGKFRLQRLVGVGAMGVVYVAVDLTLDRKVAIKTLPRTDPDRARRLKREARAMASVAHPNLATIFGVESWRGTPLLIVEYFEEGTLADRLERGPLSAAEAFDAGIMLADVLDRVHAAGLLHRDIKPTNIGWTRDGAPKLLDFGMARTLASPDDPTMIAAPLAVSVAAAAPMVESTSAASDSISLTASDHVIGTPLYLSPEAVTGHEPAPDFDLWSLGVVLYEAVAGRHPFAAATIGATFRAIQSGVLPDVRESCPDCSAAVAQFFERTLAAERQQRPRTAAEFRNWCREVRAQLASDEPPL